VKVVDLGLGNLHSVLQALRRAGAEPTLTRGPEDVKGASKLVVPGQGGFGECAAALARGYGEALREAIEAGVPYLGICLGMQLLFEGSDEAPGAAGLGLMKGRVIRFPEGEVGRKVPHMGWNRVRARHPLVDEGGWYYFVHSYHCVPEDPAVIAGEAEYGETFCAAVAGPSLFACQFHPEKSQVRGARLLERFVTQEPPWS